MLENVKLIIWDLDETLWSGTISEHEVAVRQENVDFIKNTLDMGIIHSICSKNDFESTKKFLTSQGLWEYFVFPSINWEAKGKRIENILESAGLRAANVLFIDDNLQNLQEVKYYNPEISVILPGEDLHKLYDEAETAPKKDISHNRLKQYHILEEKLEEKAVYSSNEEFLYSCHIKVEICSNCMDELERIHELVMRSNQLNYTKNRQSPEELQELFISCKVKSGYVRVRDKYGDYGIVGFFAIKDGRALHFTFSCRIMGMMVEQYVYMILGCPELDTVGTIVTELNKTYMPGWINQERGQDCKEKIDTVSHRILLKGPCDMSQMFAFINENANIDTEFTYINDNGISVEGHNHTGQIVTSLISTNKRKQEIIEEIPWFDKDMLTTKLASWNYEFVVISLLTDGNCGLYKRKNTGEYVSLCEAYYDLTDKKNWQMYINEEVFTSNILFREEDLIKFSELYEFVENRDGGMTADSLQKIYDLKPENSKIVLIMGSEKEYLGKKKMSYEGRHLIHKAMNDKIREWSKNKKDVFLMPIDKYIHEDKDYWDSINHFSKRVYYDLAKDIVYLVNSHGGEQNGTKGKSYLIKETVMQHLRKWKTEIMGAIFEK